MDVLTGIVSYNPEIKRIKENIEAISPQCAEIIIVDNKSENIDELESLIAGKPYISVVKNNENLGIARALNQIMQHANENGYKWVLLLDQDSVAYGQLIDRYMEHIQLGHVGILTCNIEDRNLKIKGIQSDGQKEVKLCITSGSLISVDAYNKTHGFNEFMFIDYVDFEMCIQIRDAGYKIIQIGYKGLMHEVGHGKNVKLFGKTYESYNHSPFRHYYMARNGLYISRIHPREFPLTRQLWQEIRFWLIILLYEEDKKDKLWARVRGIVDFCKKKRNCDETY